MHKQQQQQQQQQRLQLAANASMGRIPAVQAGVTGLAPQQAVAARMQVNANQLKHVQLHQLLTPQQQQQLSVYPPERRRQILRDYFVKVSLCACAALLVGQSSFVLCGV